MVEGMRFKYIVLHPSAKRGEPLLLLQTFYFFKFSSFLIVYTIALFYP